MLAISNTELDDEAEYKCEARNEFGKATTMAELLVNETPVPKSLPEFPMEKVQPETPLETSPPEFNAIDKQVPLEISDGGDVTLEVQVTGTPEPTVEWYKDNKPIQRSDRYLIQKKDDTHSLIIKGAGPEDSGPYQVRTYNPAGKNTRTFNVDISGK